MEEMSFEPIDGPGDPSGLADRIVWTWVIQRWPDDEPPPWRRSGEVETADLPKTWVARETIHIGYDP